MNIRLLALSLAPKVIALNVIALSKSSTNRISLAFFLAKRICLIGVPSKLISFFESPFTILAMSTTNLCGFFSKKILWLITPFTSKTRSVLSNSDLSLIDVNSETLNSSINRLATSEFPSRM